MLILSRKMDESIVIDSNTEVKIVGVEGDHIKLGIVAPRHISVHRKEVFEAIQAENKMASNVKVDLADLTTLFKQ